jgi:NTP pyrophosphatase (non-canonical NTP hydrolase)
MHNDALHNMQLEHKVWVEHNFPNSTELWVPALGVAEEAGELCHAILKMSQGIRGTKQEHRAAVEDAVGDICIYLMDLCNKMDLSFELSILRTWREVRQRDWIKYPKNGRTE